MPGHWSASNHTYIWLFNTGRGLSICIRLPNNIGIIYDLGCGDDFSPLEFITNRILPHLRMYKRICNLGQLILSHPHQDHIQETEKFVEMRNVNKCYAGLITLPHDRPIQGQHSEKLDFSRIMTDDNKEILINYKRLYTLENREPPLMTLDRQHCPPTDEDIVCGLYYMRPPEVNEIHPIDNHKYVNGVSLCFYLRHNNHSLWICGDITPEVHEKVIEGEKTVERRLTYLGKEPLNVPSDFNQKTSTQPTPKQLFADYGLTLLVTPHHGLESCFCQSLFDTLKDGRTFLNIISEKRHTGKNDGNVDSRYSQEEYAKGLGVNIESENEFRRTVSTRNGHHMLFILGKDLPEPKVFLRKDPYNLLSIT